MREHYAKVEHQLEQDFYTIDETKEEYPAYDDFELPTELTFWHDIFIEYVYIINLDQEVLTMNDGVHWKLGNIPRPDDMWIRAIVDSISGEATISYDVCSEDHMASPALDLPQRVEAIGYPSTVVTPKTSITEPHQVFRTTILASILTFYRHAILSFGREWSPESFPFRELAFALVSVASGQVEYQNRGALPDPESRRLPRSNGWLHREQTGRCEPLLKFGSMCHRPDEPPGASPTTTMYWLRGVLVSLSLTVDGGEVTKAVAWGISQGRSNFQVVTLSLFDVIFAEVSSRKGEPPAVKVSQSVYLSPLRAEACLSTHPRERPEWKEGMDTDNRQEDMDRRFKRTGSIEGLRDEFPGLAALVNFFDVAANRAAAAFTSITPFPPEIWDIILDFTDYKTWQACSLVSKELRFRCLLGYRLDDEIAILAAPSMKVESQQYWQGTPLLSFDARNVQTKKMVPMVEEPPFGKAQRGWTPIVGSERKAIILDVSLKRIPPAKG